MFTFLGNDKQHIAWTAARVLPAKKSAVSAFIIRVQIDDETIESNEEIFFGKMKERRIQPKKTKQIKRQRKRKKRKEKMRKIRVSASIIRVRLMKLLDQKKKFFLLRKKNSQEKKNEKEKS